MNIVIEVRIRSVYGSLVLDPVSTAAHHLAAIAGTKTLTAQTLASAQAMGLRVVVTPDPLASAMAASIDSLAGVKAANVDCMRRSA